MSSCHIQLPQCNKMGFLSENKDTLTLSRKGLCRRCVFFFTFWCMTLVISNNKQLNLIVLGVA